MSEQREGRAGTLAQRYIGIWEHQGQAAWLITEARISSKPLASGVEPTYEQAQQAAIRALQEEGDWRHE